MFTAAAIFDNSVLCHSTLKNHSNNQLMIEVQNTVRRPIMI